MASNQSKGAKRVRTESGVIISGSNKPKVRYVIIIFVPNDYCRNHQGEMYEKWKKKSHREIGGVLDSAEDDIDRPRPMIKGVNKHAKDELRSVEGIKKLQKTRESNKLKNMKKGKRSAIEAKSKSFKKAAQANGNSRANFQTQGKNRKSKLIIRL
jgi:hypothetical protein